MSSRNDQLHFILFPFQSFQNSRESFHLLKLNSRQKELITRENHRIIDAQRQQTENGFGINDQMEHVMSLSF